MPPTMSHCPHIACPSLYLVPMGLVSTRAQRPRFSPRPVSVRQVWPPNVRGLSSMWLFCPLCRVAAVGVRRGVLEGECPQHHAGEVLLPSGRGSGGSLRCLLRKPHPRELPSGQVTARVPPRAGIAAAWDAVAAQRPREDSEGPGELASLILRQDDRVSPSPRADQLLPPPVLDSHLVGRIVPQGGGQPYWALP